ncbi:MAG: FKBP-type peptidyl-prolyl cis-trans isomerase FklB [Halioglobus sp.]|jgi:FKBP-type peptidyl-prolyl cis-trans isomerase FklB
MSNIKLETTEELASYGIGLQMGEQLKNTFPGVSLSAALAGINHAFKGEAMAASDEAIGEAFRIIQERLAAESAEKGKEAAGKGEAFLTENAKKEGVQTTASGLQYEVMTVGDGETPSASSTVRTHYRGTLIDGTEFDSSYSRNQPTEFPVNGVIAGWTEALQLMPVGSKWKLSIPHNLAYGEKGAGGAIAPYQALVFEIELLAIVS